MELDKIIHGDCLEEMKTFPDGSIDLVATDPPYHLSDTEPLENRVKEVIRTFNDFVFPNFNEGNIQIRKYSNLSRILSQSSNLRRLENSSIGVESWISVPESAVNFNGSIIIRQIEIDQSTKSSGFSISDGKLMKISDIETLEFVGDFIFDFGDSIDFPCFDLKDRGLGEFLSGFYTMFISSIEFPFLPNSKSNESSIFFGTDFVKDIRLENSMLNQSQSSSLIMASWRTKNGFILRIDERGTSGEFVPTDTTSQSDLLGQYSRSKLVRTFAGASCLSSMFESIPIRFIFSIANRTYSFYFRLWVPFGFAHSVSNLYKTVKGFMNKEWDVMPSVAIWKECYRILKPGAFMFVMSSARQDVLSEMIVRLQTAGFRTDFTSIYWTYSSGFPKASDIALMVDKRECLKEITNKLGRKPNKEESEEAWKSFRTVVGLSDKGCGNLEGNEYREIGYIKGSGRDKEYYVTKPTTPMAQSFDGAYAGWQPKPAVELIIVVMKPLSEKSFVDQALKNRKGITWMEDARIPTQPRFTGTKKPSDSGFMKSNADDMWKRGEYWQQKYDANRPESRFPANLLVSDDILNDGREWESKAQVMKPDKGGTGISLQFKHEEEEIRGHDDSGSYSRFFDLDAWWDKKLKNLPAEVREVYPFLIVPKPSESEKHKGTEDLANETFLDESRYDKTAIGCNNPRNRSGRPRKGNIHPTTKPIKLFSYLVALGSEKEDVVLDPFVGSGTTCLAAKMLGRKYIGIERDKGYYDVATSRLESLLNKLGIQRGFFE